ncbi:MAG TPA: DUF305 domain-containing protein [Gemmatimonadales bacterium]|nr:DUF305 domain-containing protein [Gemmatimonadales bacterium]
MKRPWPQPCAAGALAVLAAAACATATQRAASGTVPPAGATPVVAAPATRARTDSGPPSYTAADVHFMAGMIGHHAQAVLMASWAPSHGASATVRTLCERIVVGQRDEIALMQRWLRDRHEAVPPADPRGYLMPGMDQAMLMPGMLTPAQMAELDRARGPAFDRLFLTFMIQHHRGAITMVDQLLSVQEAARDALVFRFASDVSADQATEIDRMTRLLDALSHTLQRSPQ